MENHEYLWTTEKDKWVLVNTEFGYAIVNKSEQSMLMVSDPNLESSIINKMIDEGCKIYNTLDEAYEDT